MRKKLVFSDVCSVFCWFASVNFCCINWSCFGSYTTCNLNKFLFFVYIVVVLQIIINELTIVFTITYANSWPEVINNNNNITPSWCHQQGQNQNFSKQEIWKDEVNNWKYNTFGRSCFIPVLLSNPQSAK